MPKNSDSVIEASRDSSLAMNSRTIASRDLSQVQSQKLFEFSLGDEVVATYHSLKDQKLFAKVSIRGTYSKRKLIVIGSELRSTASGKYTPGELSSTGLYQPSHPGFPCSVHAER